MAGITLHSIEEENLPTIRGWRNIPDVMQWCRQYRPLTMPDMKKWYDTITINKDYNLTNDLFLMRHDNEAMGVGGFVRLDWRNKKAEVSFYVGNSQKRTKEIIIESLNLLMVYAFETLGLWKVYFPVYQGNPSLKVYESVMEREYVAKQEYYSGGEYLDRIVLVKYANEHGRL